MNERICVTGAGGFIGTHLVRKLKELGYWVRGVDVKKPKWSESEADEFWLFDLLVPSSAVIVLQGIDWVFHLAADMGGMGFISTAHADIIKNNTSININTISAARQVGVKRFLFTSSVCVYPPSVLDASEHPLTEADAYPAWPGEAYGWEKMHMEHLCGYCREAGWLDTCVVRLNNTYGPLGEWEKESRRAKAPAELCRKVARARWDDADLIEVWGDGQQLRPFMYVDDCVDGLVKIMIRNIPGPLHIGPEQEVTIDYMVDVISDIAGWPVRKRHVPGPEGHRRRWFDYSLCREILNWQPSTQIEVGLVPTYEWIEEQVRQYHEREGRWP